MIIFGPAFQVLFKLLASAPHPLPSVRLYFFRWIPQQLIDSDKLNTMSMCQIKCQLNAVSCKALSDKKFNEYRIYPLLHYNSNKN